MEGEGKGTREGGQGGEEGEGRREKGGKEGRKEGEGKTEGSCNLQSA